MRIHTLTAVLFALETMQGQMNMTSGLRRHTAAWQSRAIRGALRIVCLSSLAVVLSHTVMGQSSNLPTAGLFSRSRQEYFRYQIKDYELALYKGKVIPRLSFRKIPARPVNIASISSSVESTADKEMSGFPFTTMNTGSIQFGFPRVDGKLKLSMEDPPLSADAEDTAKVVDLEYAQTVPGLGDVTAKARSTGEWGASLTRDIEEVGKLRGSLNSQFDWSIYLDKTYTPVKRITPSFTYGATQDGLYVRAQMDAALDKAAAAMYSVQNAPGKTSPSELQHDCKLSLSSSSNRHVLEMKGLYSSKLPKMPFRGSLTYLTKIRSGTLEATVDFDNYHLKCLMPYGQVAAKIARVMEDDARPIEVDLRLGKVSAKASMKGGSESPRVRLGFGS